MAAKKKNEELKNEVPVQEEEFEEEGMVIIPPPQQNAGGAPKDEEADDEEFEANLTFSVKKNNKKSAGPMVDIFLPRLEDDGSITVDQYERVTIANEAGEPERWRILRGEHVEVPARVFMVLHEKYGKEI